jgi:hypothetical protein
MLRHAHDLMGVHVGAADGDVGHLHDLYFDDQQWAIRYLVVDTGIGSTTAGCSLRRPTSARWTGAAGG